MNKKSKIEIERHSLSHIMAAAVLEMFPEAKLGIGPDIENGFYYDFELPRTLIPEDLPLLQEKMNKIISENHTFEKEEMDIEEAIKFFEKANQPYKIELIKDLEKDGEKKVSLYRSGAFVDLCSGPHVESTGEINKKSFKLDKIAGAYWKGEEKNKMLQRIYGLAFDNPKELRKFISNREEAEKCDHRVLNKKLNLFHIDEVIGPGLPTWLPKGARLWQIIEDFWNDKHLTEGYDLVKTPHIGHKKLWVKSGHWGFFKENMYSPIKIDKDEYLLKPMNCPLHVRQYTAGRYSYRELPLRWAENGTVYRYEKSGELSGLTRVRGFTQDDAHIICREDQVKEELLRVAKFIVDIFNTFGFKDFKIYLSLRDPKDKKKYAGHDKGWELTEKVLEEVAREMKFDYIKEEGEAAFYGPKLDFKIKDAFGREWQTSTLQFDFNLPERFEMTFINAEGKKERPYMLHRALFGSYERFLGLLIEHYCGAFPVWLSPVQATIIPVSEKFIKEADKIYTTLKENRIRVDMDDREESVGKKISEFISSKNPYAVVIGEKEIKENVVMIRNRSGKLEKMNLDQFINKIEKEVEQKK